MSLLKTDKDQINLRQLDIRSGLVADLNSMSGSTAKNLKLTTQIQYLKGVGPKLAVLFERRGVRTIKDLLEYFPRAFEDRRAARKIASLNIGDVVSLKAQLFKVNSIPMGKSHRRIYDVILRDDSGVIHCKYFRVPFKGYFERFQPFAEVRVTGKVIEYRGKKEFHHPDIQAVIAEQNEELQDAVIPIYPEIENLSSAKIHKLISLALEEVKDEEWLEVLPAKLLENLDLPTFRQALYRLHHPVTENLPDLNSFKDPAQIRFIFEEFFWLELYLAAKKSGLKKEKSRPLSKSTRLVPGLLKALPFRLTGAQTQAFAEIEADLQLPHPMNRLVQGDVGSGKTLVCFLAALQAIENQFQVALMAPTEILAEQHFTTAHKLLSPLGVRVELLTGSSKTAERSVLLQKLKIGEIDLLIGTHALIEDSVEFFKIGLVIIDEQHRFGVEQRASLKKNQSPHTLVMTATPIPRTLALTVYGDLDVSVIDELPPGRTPIQTRSIFETKRPAAIQFMADQVAKGRQAYIIYPLVEESEKIDLKNAVHEFEKLKNQFSQIAFGLLHGKMKPPEKDKVMQEFRKGEIQVLVSTTVIEVGVDVPNATVMIIEHAERFGLSQLHQLRGRVGRGSQKSSCILISGYAVGEDSKKRLEIMEQTSDGFKIAEADLEIRGPGEFLGVRQSGLPGFKLANLIRDVKVLQLARQSAFAILQEDPSLSEPAHQGLRDSLLRQRGPTALAGIA